MKWKLFVLMLFTIIALTYCTQDYLSDSAKETSEVIFNFSASLPDDVNQTRAASINRYIMEVYKTAEPTVLVKRVEQAGGTIIVPLENNTDYICIFWADEVAVDDNTNGTFNALDLKNVTLNTGKTMTDAFFARLDIVDATTTFNVTLRRASAKVNIVATEAVAANTDVTITYAQYRSFNTFSSEVAGTAVETDKTFNSAETIGVLGTFLTFASVSGILTDFTAVYNSEITNEIINTPLKANYITNISGNYASGSEDFVFIITIDEVWSIIIGGIDINLGTTESPQWIKVADRNAEKDGASGATADNTFTDYGYYYYWSNEGSNPTDVERAHQACFDFGNGSGEWRLPTKEEWSIVSGNDGINHTVNDDRRVKWDGTTWKLYGERSGMEDEFVYFPLAGSSNTTNHTGSGSIGTTGLYWTSTDDGNDTYLMRIHQDGSSKITFLNVDYALSVRCVKGL